MNDLKYSVPGHRNMHTVPPELEWIFNNIQNTKNSAIKRFKDKKLVPDQTEKSSLAVKLDYSDIYKENAELDEELEDQLWDLNKDKTRSLSAKRETLRQYRLQVEFIGKLKDTVNSRQPGDSIKSLSRSRLRRKNSKRQEKESNSEMTEREMEVYDFPDLARETRSKVRHSMELEKYSAKNFFNVRRPATTTDKQLRRQKSRVYSLTKDTEQLPKKDLEVRKPLHSTKEEKIEKNNSSKDVNNTEYEQTVSERQELLESNSKPGSRPQTAIDKKSTEDTILPPRAKSVQRSRSRRELEILSRISINEEHEESESALINRQITIREYQRRRKLLELKVQRQELQTKVDTFLSKLERMKKCQETSYGVTDDYIQRP